MRCSTSYFAWAVSRVIPAPITAGALTIGPSWTTFRDFNVTQLPAGARVEKRVSMTGTKGLIDLLPSALQGLTKMPWVQTQPSYFFYQVEGVRARISPSYSDGYRVEIDAYRDGKLIPKTTIGTPCLAFAIQLAENAVHEGCSTPAFVPDESWLDVPATQPQLDSLRDHMRMGHIAIESRWEAQQAMNRYFSRLRQRRRRK